MAAPSKARHIEVSNFQRRHSSIDWLEHPALLAFSGFIFIGESEIEGDSGRSVSLQERRNGQFSTITFELEI
jgi:hypothetical protein